MTYLRLAVAAFAIVHACQAEVCNNEETCSAKSKASAMLQVTAKSHNFHGAASNEDQDTPSAAASEETDEDQKPRCSADPALVETHLDQARLCLPQGLPERHLSALRRQAALLTSKAKSKEEVIQAKKSNLAGESSQVADTSLPLRNGDVIRLLQPKHGTRVGWWGSNGGDFTAACPLSGVKHGIQGFSGTPERTLINIEVDGDDTYFMQPGHGSYLGICSDSPQACGSDTGLASVNGYSSKVDATKFDVVPTGENVYLNAKLTNKYLAFACPSPAPFSTNGGAAHNVHGYPDATGSALLQQGGNQSAITRTMFTVEFISRTTTTTTTTTTTVTTTTTTTTTEAPAVDGASASLDAAGFKAVTTLCCPPEMEVFFERLLTSMGLDICSKPHVQGLMHWFSCVPDMDFQYLLDVINNGNPCKYWTASGSTCPALSAECEGTWCR